MRWQHAFPVARPCRAGCAIIGAVVGWLGCGLAIIAVVQGCQKPKVASNANEGNEAQEPVEKTPEPVDLPIRVDIGKAMDEPQRWLFVNQARDAKAGAWATGSFDARRNKLSVRTENVERFTVDTSCVPIDWEKLVVMRINGKNSELRQRDNPVMVFALDEHNRWVVIEK